MLPTETEKECIPVAQESGKWLTVVKKCSVFLDRNWNYEELLNSQDWQCYVEFIEYSWYLIRKM
jgi:hypothetical protein